MSSNVAVDVASAADASELMWLLPLEKEALYLTFGELSVVGVTYESHWEPVEGGWGDKRCIPVVH